MSSTASLQFTPEWLKPRKPIRQPSASALGGSSGGGGTAFSSDPLRSEDDGARKDHHATTYSSLLSGRVSPPLESSAQEDNAHPFRYSKEQLLKVWKDGGGRGALNLEVERWPGVVREVGAEPMSLKEWGDDEKKLFAQPLHGGGFSQNHNHPTRRQPHGALPISTSGGSAKTAFGVGLGSPRSERFGQNGALGSPGSGTNISNTLGRRRKDDSGDPPVALYRPRQLSISNNPTNGTPSSPNNPLPSPRPRLTPGVDGVLGDSWIRKKPIDNKPAILAEAPEDEPGIGSIGVNNELGADKESPGTLSTEFQPERLDSVGHEPLQESPSSFHHQDNLVPDGRDSYLDTSHTSNGFDSRRQQSNVGTESSAFAEISGMAASLPPVSNEDVLWRYRDPSGQIQGPFASSLMQNWYSSNYFAMDLLIQRFHPPWNPTDPNEFEPLAEYKKKLPPQLESQLFIRGLELAPSRPPNLPIPVASAFSDDASFMLGRSRPQFTESGYDQQPSLSHPYQSIANGRIVSQNLPSRHQSIDSFSNGTPSASAQSAQASPAFGNSLAQSISASGLNNPVLGNVASNSGTIGQAGGAERHRQEREEFFNRLRESELASNGSFNGLGSGSIGGGPSSALFGGGLSGQQPVSRSPLVSSAVPAQAWQPGASSQQGSYIPSASPVGPRHIQGQYAQPSGISQNTFPTQAPDAWQQPLSTGNLARHLGSQLSYPQEERSAPPVDPGSWGIPTSSQDPFLSQQPSSVWQHQQEQLSTSYEPPRRSSPLSYSGLHERYSTSVAVQQVQSRSAGNFGLPKGFVDPRTESISGLSHVDTYTSASPAASTNNAQIHPPNEASVERVESSLPVEVPAPIEPTPQSVSNAPAPVIQAPTTSPPKSRSSKSTAPASTSVPPKGEASVSVTQTSEATETASAPKPAWSNVSPNIASGASAGASLREIQEAEAKRSEARKAAEKEKERALRAAAAVAVPPSSSLEELPKTTSWGLPQVGQKTAASAASSPATASAPAPAWSTATASKAIPAKKTMKEIQEEEEMRKKTQAAREAAAAASNDSAFVAAAGRKAYVDTAKSADSAKPPIQSGPWTTVGASGKAIASTTPATPTAAAAPSRPPVTATRSVASIAAASLPPKPVAASSSTKKLDDKIPPSPEFVKWVKEALRGLTGVNLDEFVTMLFDFPIEPDASTMEIISDSVYANSSTLDGRRFATEFVAKRKADAAARSGKGLPGKPISIADVVKTQPKPVQQEWAYKVVKKKGKKN